MIRAVVRRHLRKDTYVKVALQPDGYSKTRAGESLKRIVERCTERQNDRVDRRRHARACRKSILKRLRRHFVRCPFHAQPLFRLPKARGCFNINDDALIWVGLALISTASLVSVQK
jgi:hypothetical protein